MALPLTIGLSLSLSGAYAAMGRQAEAALRLFVSDFNAAGGLHLNGNHHELALECHDDASDPARCAEIYRSLCFKKRADLIFGPYSSRLTRIAAPIAEEAGMVMVNHGGAADDLHDLRNRMLVGVATPASDYLRDFARLVGSFKFFRKRIATVSARTAFARAVMRGFEHACSARAVRMHGVRIRLKYNGSIEAEDPPPRLLAALRRNRINVLASAGGFAHDVAVVSMVISQGLNIPVLACVAAGVQEFYQRLGAEAEGIVGPSQWEENLDITPAIGPGPDEFARRMRAMNGLACDYPAAQAYAAGLLTIAASQAANSLDQNRLRAAFSGLRTTTMFGDFAIDDKSGRQIGHKMLLVQWHGGRKMVIDPEPRTENGALEFPSGWRLLLASFQLLRLKGTDEEPDEIEDDEEN